MTATSSYLNQPVLSERERRLVDAINALIDECEGACRYIANSPNHCDTGGWLGASYVSTREQARALIREITREG